ncbi:MAG: hypothetical protein OXJ62_00460 [Spirochaetaceae bacterium]|nr:hypothetical protein [Spirochaetaceae bacterium]
MAAVAMIALGMLLVGLAVPALRRRPPRRPTGLGTARIRRARER